MNEILIDGVYVHKSKQAPKGYELRLPRAMTPKLLEQWKRVNRVAIHEFVKDIKTPAIHAQIISKLRKKKSRKVYRKQENLLNRKK